MFNVAFQLALMDAIGSEIGRSDGPDIPSANASREYRPGPSVVFVRLGIDAAFARSRPLRSTLMLQR